MIVSLFISRSALIIEKLALRQQLSVYHYSKKRPKIRLRDRLFWIIDFQMPFFLSENDLKTPFFLSKNVIFIRSYQFD